MFEVVVQPEAVMTVTADGQSSEDQNTTREYSPATNTQKAMFAENHVVVYTTVRERLESYPLWCTRATSARLPRRWR